MNTAVLAASASNADMALIVAMILFAVAGVIRLMHDAIDGGLIALGFAAVVLAWIIV